MSSPGANRSRRRSARRRAARGLAPKLRPGTRRRLDVNAPYVVRPEVYLRIREVVRKSGVVPYLNTRLHSHRGEKCSYDAETLLVGVLLTVTFDLDMELTNITKALGSLAAQSRFQLGLVRSDGTVVSYRSVHHQLSRLAEALRVSWVADDGTECDANWMLTRLLHAAVPKRYREVSAVAIDATAVETWGGFIGSPSLLSADPSVTKAARQAREAYPDDEPTSLDQALDEARPTPRSGKRPNARKSTGDPVIGPDGRVVHTSDIDARGGYRTATSVQAGQTFVGYHTHLATAVRDFTWQGDVTRGTLGEYVPPFILGMETVPANTHSGHVATRMLERIIPELPNMREVIADRGYTMLTPDTFIWPARAMGLDVIMDLSKAQLRRTNIVEVARRRSPGGVETTETVLINAGTVLHDWTPPAMRTLPALPMDYEKRPPIRAKYEARANQWRWSVQTRDRTTGDVRFRCPFCAGRVRSRTIKASKRVAATVPSVKVPAGSTQCCRGTLTVDPATLTELWQPVPYGTGAWAQSYGRRAIAETANALLKSSFARLQRGYFKVMGLHKVSLLIGMLCVGVNIQIAQRLEEFGAPPELTEEQKEAKRKARGGRQRRERTLAELAKRYPSATATGPPGPGGEP